MKGPSGLALVVALAASSGGVAQALPQSLPAPRNMAAERASPAELPSSQLPPPRAQQLPRSGFNLREQLVPHGLSPDQMHEFNLQTHALNAQVAPRNGPGTNPAGQGPVRGERRVAPVAHEAVAHGAAGSEPRLDAKARGGEYATHGEAHESAHGKNLPPGGPRATPPHEAYLESKEPTKLQEPKADKEPKKAFKDHFLSKKDHGATGHPGKANSKGKSVAADAAAVTKSLSALLADMVRPEPLIAPPQPRPSTKAAKKKASPTAELAAEPEVTAGSGQRQLLAPPNLKGASRVGHGGKARAVQTASAHDVASFKEAAKAAAQQAARRAQHEGAARAAVLPFGRRLAGGGKATADAAAAEAEATQQRAPAAQHMPLAPRGPHLGGPLAAGLHAGAHGLRAPGHALAMPNKDAEARGAPAQRSGQAQRALQAQHGPPGGGPPGGGPPGNGGDPSGGSPPGGGGGPSNGGPPGGGPHGPLPPPAALPPPPANPDDAATDEANDGAAAVEAAAAALAAALQAYRAAHGGAVFPLALAGFGAASAGDWSAAVAADQSACAVDFEALCGGAVATDGAGEDHHKHDGGGGQQGAALGPLGFGSNEADQCLRDHRAATSVGCRAAVARTDALYRSLAPRGEWREEGGGGIESGHALLNVALLAALLAGCGVARRHRAHGRRTRRGVGLALAALENHPELKASLEDAAGVALPSPQWQFKVRAALAANPPLRHALAAAEANGLASEASVDEQPQLTGVGHGHGAGGHFDPFHGGPPPHHPHACHRRRRCAKRLAAALLLLVAASVACHALRGGGGGAGGRSEAPSGANPGGDGADGQPPPPLAGVALVLVAAAVAACCLKAGRHRTRAVHGADGALAAASAEHFAVAVPLDDAEHGLAALGKGAHHATAAVYPGASEAAKATQAGSGRGAVSVPSNAVVVVSVRAAPGLGATL